MSTFYWPKNLASLIMPLFVLSPSYTVFAQALNVFDTSQEAQSITSYLAGTPVTLAEDIWTGTYDMTVTGSISGGSSLPNPGLESSASGAFFADQTFGLSTWYLSGWATGSYDAGLGKAGSAFPTVYESTHVGVSFDFYVDVPFTLTLAGDVFDEFIGPGPSSGFQPSNQGYISLVGLIVNGQLVNEPLVEWASYTGSTGGTYTRSFDSGVFRFSVNAGANDYSNIPDAQGTQFSSYDAVLNVSPVAVPEPGSVLLLGLSGAFFVFRRRRRDEPHSPTSA